MVIENVDGVATIDGGVALILLQQNAEAAGYSRFFHKCITFAQYGDPENRSKRVMHCSLSRLMLSAASETMDLADAYRCRVAIGPQSQKMRR